MGKNKRFCAYEKLDCDFSMAAFRIEPDFPRAPGAGAVRRQMTY